MIRSRASFAWGTSPYLLSAMTMALVCSGCDLDMNDYSKKRFRKDLSSVDKASKELKNTERKLTGLIDEDNAFMSKTKTIKQAQEALAKARAELSKLKDLGRKLSKLIDKNKRKDEKKAYTITVKIERGIKAFRRRLALIIKPVRTLRHAKKNAKQLTRQVEATRATVTSYPPATVTAAVEKAGKKYPKAKEDVEAHVKALGGKDVIALADAFDAARKKSPPDYLAMGRLATQLRSRSSKLTHERKRLLGRIRGLDDHVDTILVDMKDERGRFYHRYKSVFGPKVTTGPWTPVTAALFRSHQDHLGMAVYAKPKGTFHTRAYTIASPPGYVYVDDKEYGKWIDAGGEKTWKFHDKYSYMVPLFFGAGLAAVTYVAFQSFRKHRNRKMVWFGLGVAIWYGTRSALMRKRYKGYYARKARKIRVRRARRSGSRRAGRSGRSSRRSGK